MEWAARLEYMAEARGRPRPGALHPEALQDDPDGLLEGEQPEDANFDCEDALPGGADYCEDHVEQQSEQADPELNYAARYALDEDQAFDAIHRLEEAQRQRRSARSGKQKLFENFMQAQERSYMEASRPRGLRPQRIGDPASAGTTQDNAAARRRQQELQEARLAEETAPRPSLQRRSKQPSAAGEVRKLGPERVPISPMELTTKLIACSGVWRSKEQYLAALFMLEPLEEIWRQALREGCATDLGRPEVLLRFLKETSVRSVFLHGPGGSGKTWCVTEVVLKVVRHFLGEQSVKAIAATNSAARLLRGKTMHASGKMKRGQSMKARQLKPNARSLRPLQREWQDAFLLVEDEMGLAPPPLQAGISRRAFHGRAHQLGFRCAEGEELDHPFGDVPIQVGLGDFLQLNTVASHTCMEAVCTSPVPGVPKKTTDEDRDGYKVFRYFLRNVILFRSSHRFLDDDLPMLLEIMRTPGGKRVPSALRAKILAQCQRGPSDHRLDEDYMVDGVRGFFACGASAAIVWEQVTRMMQLQVLKLARLSRGPAARYNKEDGKPDLSSMPARPQQGQLVFYFQAVDRFKHAQGKERYMQALQFVNLSKTAGLHGMCPVYVGMRVRLTKKVYAPDLVQEATGEVIEIEFHPSERFGDPSSSHLRPADSHECWERGWVVCDRLPLHVAIRFDGCSEDYTGLGKPGVWHLEPKKDVWHLPIERTATIDHPGAPRPKVVKLTRRKDATLEVTRCQLALTHESEGTYQNWQGKTARGPRDEPKGFIVDLFKPNQMSQPEYFQHIHMILGRVRKLEWLMIRNFPLDENSEPDWKIFEGGPSDYLCELMAVLEERAKQTYPRLLRAQRSLGMPAWEDIKPCPPDPEHEGRFLYVPDDWGITRPLGRADRFVPKTAKTPVSNSDKKQRRTSQVTNASSSTAPTRTQPSSSSSSSLIRTSAD